MHFSTPNNIRKYYYDLRLKIDRKSDFFSKLILLLSFTSRPDNLASEFNRYPNPNFSTKIQKD
jgi:hypothetical protein